ncbi:hypothetical protein HKD37_01G001353 [Glycine soja]
MFPFNFCFVNYSVVYKSKGETKDIELVEEEQARIGADPSSGTSNKSENYKEEARKKTQKHKPKRVESVNADAEAFGDDWKILIALCIMGNSAKVVIQQDMKGRRHKYGFNNNEREKAQKKRVVDDETADKHQLDEIMGSPPASTTPPPPPSPPSPPRPPPTSDASASTSAVKRTRKASRLRSPVVHVDPATGKADSPHKKKLRTYLGIVARDKVDITYENWKEVPTAQKDLIWEDIQAEFDILEASDSRTKRKLLQTVGERWRQFKSDLTRKWALAADQDGVEGTVCDKYGISKEKWAQFCQTRRDPSWENTAPHVLSRGGYDYLEQKLLAEKTKKKMQEAAQSGSVDGVIDPPSPVRRHVKWKMARTKKTGEMTTEAAKEIAEKIDSFEEQATQGSFVPHGRQDVLAATIGRPEHPGRVRAAGAGVTIKQYFGSAPRTSRSASSLPPDELQQLTQQIRDQLEESITEKVTRQVMASFSQLQSQMQSQGPPEPLVGLGSSGPRVSTKGSCVDPSGNDPETSDSDRCGLYIEVDPARLVAVGRVYEGSTLIHNTPLLLGQVKVSVDEVKDAHAAVPVPTTEVSLVGQALHTFLAWPTHLIKSLSNQVAVSSPKPPPKPDPEVDDPLYLMTLTIPELFLRPYQVRWDATMFRVVNPDFPLYIKHEDLSEIAHSGQCLSISVLQLWILSGQSQFESESYIKSWMQSSQRDVYLGVYLNGGHWQMVVILPKEHLVVWFCSLHNRPDNYLKGIINSAIKGLDDAPQPKSKAPARWIVVKCNRQKGTTECGYYMSTIILGSFRNNWEAYFNDPRPLEPERLKALRIQWAQFYLRKSRLCRAALYPMVVMTYSTLPLGDLTMGVVFVQRGQLDEVNARLREEMRSQLREEMKSQIEEENKGSLEKMTMALKEAIKIELIPVLTPIEADILELGARVSIKGSKVETGVHPSEKDVADVIPSMGLYVQCHVGTQLVALGKILQEGSTIHSVAYADDMVRVSVEKVIHGDAEVPYPTSEIQYVRQALDTFITWPT